MNHAAEENKQETIQKATKGAKKKGKGKRKIVMK